MDYEKPDHTQGSAFYKFYFSCRITETCNKLRDSPFRAPEVIHISGMRGGTKELRRLLTELQRCNKHLFQNNNGKIPLKQAEVAAGARRAFASSPMFHGNLTQALRARGPAPSRDHLFATASTILRRECRSLDSAVWKRLFSSEPPPPRQGWDKFYPKGKGRRPSSSQAKGAKGNK